MLESHFLKAKHVPALQAPAQSITKSLSVDVYGSGSGRDGEELQGNRLIAVIKHHRCLARSTLICRLPGLGVRLPRSIRDGSFTAAVRHIQMISSSFSKLTDWSFRQQMLRQNDVSLIFIYPPTVGWSGMLFSSSAVL